VLSVCRAVLGDAVRLSVPEHVANGILDDLALETRVYPETNDLDCWADCYMAYDNIFSFEFQNQYPLPLATDFRHATGQLSADHIYQIVATRFGNEVQLVRSM
jgi:hypothetical protein